MSSDGAAPFDCPERILDAAVALGLAAGEARDALRRQWSGSIEIHLRWCVSPQHAGRVVGVRVETGDGGGSWVGVAEGHGVRWNGRPGAPRLHPGAVVVFEEGTRGWGDFLPPQLFVGEGAGEPGPLRRLLLLFEALHQQLTDEIGERGRVIDPQRAPPAALPWLASWFGQRLPESATLGQRRGATARLFRWARTRGTAVGLRERVKFWSGIDVRILERTGPQPVRLGVARLCATTSDSAFPTLLPAAAAWLGDGAGRPESWFMVELPPRATLIQRFGAGWRQRVEAAVRVVSEDCPAHLRFVFIHEQAAPLGAGAQLGPDGNARAVLGRTTWLMRAEAPSWTTGPARDSAPSRACA